MIDLALAALQGRLTLLALAIGPSDDGCFRLARKFLAAHSSGFHQNAATPMTIHPAASIQFTPI